MGRASRRKREQRAEGKARPPMYQRDDKLFVGRPPLPTVEAWIDQNRDKMSGPGHAGIIEIRHDASCDFPRGGLFCTCKGGPECKFGETL